jgi:hypothetical protein
MGVSISSSARRWVSVAVASMSKSAPSASGRWMWLRVRVARWSSRPRKSCSGWLSSPRLARVLASAAGERWAVATGWSRWGGCSSV